MSQQINTVGPEYLAPLLRKTVETIKSDARRKPEALPPRLKIPGNAKLLWLESDVIDWIKACSTAKQKAPDSIFKGRKSSKLPS